jgi:hypothetical protein
MSVKYNMHGRDEKWTKNFHQETSKEVIKWDALT